MVSNVLGIFMHAFVSIMLPISARLAIKSKKNDRNGCWKLNHVICDTYIGYPLQNIGHYG